MILTVTLNPAIDKILILDAFEVHKLHRLQTNEISLAHAGGKGVNIAQTLIKLGDEVIASGFAGGHAGHLLCDHIRKAGITTNFIFTQGITRTNISILDKQNKTLTEINDLGPEISPDDVQFFLENYERLLNRVELVVIAGSIPYGVSDDVFRHLIGKAYEHNKKVIVHTSPRHTEVLMESHPFLINPDMRSNHILFEKTVDGIDQFLEAGDKILSRCDTCEFVIFTHRLENVVAITPNQAYILRPVDMQIVNMLGYGDAYLAGFIHAYLEGKTIPEVLRYASAAGLTDVESLYKEISDITKIESNLSRIEIEQVQ